MVDVLSILMLREKENGLTEGFLVGRNRIRVFLLYLVDDTIFFCKASLERLQNLKNILLIFWEFSCLKINLEKSFSLGINTNKVIVFSLASVLDCCEFGWPLSYLGLPFGRNSKLKVF